MAGRERERERTYYASQRSHTIGKGRMNGEGMERGWGGMRVSEVERERKGNEERRKQEEYH